MNGDGERENRIALVPGAVPRAIRGLEAKRRVDRALHGIVCQTPTPRTHAEWWYDLRRKKLQAWGGILRYIDLAVMQGVDRKLLLNIPELIYHYVNEQCDERDAARGNPKRAA